MLTTGMVTYLQAQSTLTALIGTGSTSIRPIPAPADLGLYPLVTYQVSSYSEESANDGPVGVGKQRVIFNCLSLQYDVARAIALALKTIFEGISVAIATAAPAAFTLPDGTRVFDAEVANVADRWEDGSRVSCTSVHLLIQSNE